MIPTINEFLIFGKVFLFLLIVPLSVYVFLCLLVFIKEMPKTISLMRFIYVANSLKPTRRKFLQGWFSLLIRCYDLRGGAVLTGDVRGEWKGVGNWKYIKDGKEYEGKKWSCNNVKTK